MPLTQQERQRNYYEKNRETILEKNKEKQVCLECGALITRLNMARHKKTTTHLLKAKIIKYEFIPDDEEAEAEAEK
jgi:ribosomal protein S27AE